MLLACSWHLGVIPSAGYALTEVRAPVVEAGADERMRRALDLALAAHSAHGAAPLSAVVEDFGLRPSLRAEEGLVYEASLSLRVRSGARERLVVVKRREADPGSAGLAEAARGALFDALAARAAEEAVVWLVAGEAGGG